MTEGLHSVCHWEYRGQVLSKTIKNWFSETLSIMPVENG